MSAIFFLAGAAWAGDTASPTVLHWSEGLSGCTFSAGDDGRYRYGLWTSDFGVVLIVDSQELQKAERRTLPVFAIALSLEQRAGNITVKPSGATLEFVKHEHDTQKAIDPEELAREFQDEADRRTADANLEISKNPHGIVEKQAELEAYKKDIEQMIRFIKTDALREKQLDVLHPMADGWLFFHARDKWIGAWKEQEELVLRIPVADKIIKFPFPLLPPRGEFLLRRRH